MLTFKQVLSEVRNEAKRAGLTFKVQPRLSINGSCACMFIDRRTKESVLTSCTLASAYNNCCSGYIASYDREMHTFRGI